MCTVATMMMLECARVCSNWCDQPFCHLGSMFNTTIKSPHSRKHSVWEFSSIQHFHRSRMTRRTCFWIKCFHVSNCCPLIRSSDVLGWGGSWQRHPDFSRLSRCCRWWRVDNNYLGISFFFLPLRLMHLFFSMLLVTKFIAVVCITPLILLWCSINGWEVWA